jgi:hypothetical protein
MEEKMRNFFIIMLLLPVYILPSQEISQMPDMTKSGTHLIYPGRDTDILINELNNITLNLKPIGWSTNGMFAYQVTSPENREILFIYNLVSDDLIYTDTGSYNSDYERNRTTNEWNALLRKYNIIGEIKEFGHNYTNSPEQFPFYRNNNNHSCWFEYFSPSLDNSYIYWFIYIGSKNYKEIVNNNMDYDFEFVSRKIIGYYKSPYEERIAIMILFLKESQERDYITVRPFGCHLNVGFSSNPPMPELGK